jgi:hypothetical protein
LNGLILKKMSKNQSKPFLLKGKIMQTRTQLLEDLLNYSYSLEDIEDGLKMYPWDTPKGLVVLDHKRLFSMLERYLQKKITASELEHWANLVEIREDIGFPENEEALLSSIVFELANPVLFGELSEQSVGVMLGKIREAFL